MNGERQPTLLLMHSEKKPMTNAFMAEVVDSAVQRLQLVADRFQVRLPTNMLEEVRDQLRRTKSSI